ncbi:hypothetical protein NDU88_005523 [Pleurodeles waltl]|uniref:Uncharacterized protein n=1 Tax=Pleurodeles waltl TaxID=8319 RepID=A0AAV7W825_PLEWA|nr:hypothetical protein NDU88_005523 [Pleurodeles waltl]
MHLQTGAGGLGLELANGRPLACLHRSTFLPSAGGGDRARDADELTSREAELDKIGKALLAFPSAMAAWERLKHQLNDTWVHSEVHDKAAARKQWYLKGNKTGRLLARLIRSEFASRMVLTIRDQEGCEVHTQQAINEAFDEHLHTVYLQSPSMGDINALSEYLEVLPLATISCAASRQLGTPIDRQELLEA